MSLGTKTHFALSLLGFHEIDAMTIWFGKNTDWTKRFVVYGYSAILALLCTDPKDYGMILEQPCEAVAVEAATISEEKNLDDLLDLFLKRRFGFAYVERTGGKLLGGFANLRDLVKLYERSVIKTDLLVGDVASYPVVSMSAETDLKSVMDKISGRTSGESLSLGTQNTISDREIISHVSSIFRLGEVSKNPSGLLDENWRSEKYATPHR